MNPIFYIAQNELTKIIKHPLVIIVSCTLFLLAILNGVASAYTLPVFESLSDGNDHFLSVGISNTFYTTSLMISILSASLGVLSIIEDKSNGSLSVLLSKPLYRRDYIAGKFIGLSSFIIFLIVINILLSTSMIMLSYNGPSSIQESVLRLSSYTIILSLMCIEMMGIAMLIGILFKDIYQVLIIFGTLLCFEWLFNIPVAVLNFIGNIKVIFPVTLYITIISGNGNTMLFDTSGSFNTWLNSILPYAVILVLITVTIFLIICYVFNIQEP